MGQPLNNVLLIDFEATGLDTQEARIIEVGAMVTDEKFGTPLKTYSRLVLDGDYILTPIITEITGITMDMLMTDGVKPAVMFEELGELVDASIKYVIAYNRSYDEQLFKAECRRHTMTLDPKMNYLFGSPWLCAMTDIEKNYKLKSWKQMHVALDYGITVNPKELHRAINDVELMRQILVESGTTIEEMYEYQTSPWLYVRAMCAKPWEDDGVSTKKAKELGYMWEKAKGDPDAKTFNKCWVKRIKERNMSAEEAAAPFPIRVIS